MWNVGQSFAKDEIEEYRGRSFAAHVLNRILITEPIRSLDRVVRVPAPVIRVRVTEGSVNASLGSDGVGASGEELGDASSLETLLGQAEGSAKTRTTGTDDLSYVSDGSDWRSRMNQGIGGRK